MGAVAAVAGGAQLGGSIISGLGQYGAGVFNNEMAQYDAHQLDAMASEAVNNGEKEAHKVGIKGGQFAGEQAAAAAGQGIDVSTGTAKDLQLETFQENANDQALIRLNAQREALGIRTQGVATRAAGKQSLSAGQYGAAGTVLTGTGSALSTLSAAKQSTSG